MLTLTDEQTQALQEMVDAGRYDSVEAALEELISSNRPLPLTEAELAEHRRRIAEIERGEGILEYSSSEEFKSALTARVNELAKAKVL